MSVNSLLVDLFGPIVLRGSQIHFSTLPANPPIVIKCLLCGYIWPHCPRGLLCPSSCCGFCDARESQAAERFGNQEMNHRMCRGCESYLKEKLILYDSQHSFTTIRENMSCKSITFILPSPLSLSLTMSDLLSLTYWLYNITSYLLMNWHHILMNSHRCESVPVLLTHHSNISNLT